MDMYEAEKQKNKKKRYRDKLGGRHNFLAHVCSYFLKKVNTIWTNMDKHTRVGNDKQP